MAKAHPRTSPPDTSDACRTKDAVSRQLDDELEQSFPASDPPSLVRSTPTECDVAKPPAKDKEASKNEKHRPNG